MSPSPPKIEVSVAKLQEMFNTGGYEEEAEKGDLRVQVTASHPAPPKANQPPGTLSQMIAYLDAEGNEVAAAHRYLKTDGTLGASGHPDPKRIMKDGILYVAWW